MTESPATTEPVSGLVIELLGIVPDFMPVPESAGASKTAHLPDVRARTAFRRLLNIKDELLEDDRPAGPQFTLRNCGVRGDDTHQDHQIAASHGVLLSIGPTLADRGRSRYRSCYLRKPAAQAHPSSRTRRDSGDVGAAPHHERQTEEPWLTDQAG